MRNNNLDDKALHCISLIKSINYTANGISDYNQGYIKNLIPNLDYYFKIYRQAINCLNIIDTRSKNIIDFGGGHGFLSIFLKTLGFNVIYCDINENSARTINIIKQQLGIGPDYIISGSTQELVDFCNEKNIQIDYLIATDLIEHVYNLDDFFGLMQILNPKIKMVFTTGSNPYNPLKTLQLRKMMLHDEKHYRYPARLQYIIENFNHLEPSIIRKIASRTRGYNYKDIHKSTELFMLSGILPHKIEAFNTCDPENGNWDERILPFKSYKASAIKSNFNIHFLKGEYNNNRKNPLKKNIVNIVNRLIHTSGFAGWIFTPYVVLMVFPCQLTEIYSSK